MVGVARSLLVCGTEFFGDPSLSMEQTKAVETETHGNYLEYKDCRKTIVTCISIVLFPVRAVTDREPFVWVLCSW